MAYPSLTDFIEKLDAAGELLRVPKEVSPCLEITEIADRMVKNGGKAILFEKTGTAFPLLINAFASDRRMALALGTDRLESIALRMDHLFHQMTGPKEKLWDKLKVLPLLKELSDWMPKTIKARGACQEVVMDPPDLSKLPVLTCWPADGGPFITLPCVHTRDPETGQRNLGMYRMQCFTPVMTGMHWHLHKGAAHHYEGYKKQGIRMPVSVTLGGDPAYTYAATAPLPENLDEYLLAGFLREKKVKMVKCLTNDLEIPADVDFVIEGYIDPEEEMIWEGPFGDHTGFYSLPDYFPRFHVTCITHRKNAVYPATIVGIPPQEDGWIGKATEVLFKLPIRLSVAPELISMHMPAEGVFHNIALVSIQKRYPGQGIKTMNALWGAGQMMFNKVMAVFDPEVDLTDYLRLAQIISERVDPLSDLCFSSGPADILDHSSARYAYGGKMGIDATAKSGGENGRIAGNGELFVKRGDILQSFPEIKAINDQLIGLGIRIVIFSVKKSRPNHLRELAGLLLTREMVQNIKFLVFVDDPVTVTRLADVVWLTANNIDPARDCFRPEKASGDPFPVLCIDGTNKNGDHDQFARPWPNVIVMDEATITRVDERWNTLELGSFLPSPSLVYRKLVKNSGAFFYV